MPITVKSAGSETRIQGAWVWHHFYGFKRWDWEDSFRWRYVYEYPHLFRKYLSLTETLIGGTAPACFAATVPNVVTIDRLTGAQTGTSAIYAGINQGVNCDGEFRHPIPTIFNNGTTIDKEWGHFDPTFTFWVYDFTTRQTLGDLYTPAVMSADLDDIMASVPWASPTWYDWAHNIENRLWRDQAGTIQIENFFIDEGGPTCSCERLNSSASYALFITEGLPEYPLSYDLGPSSSAAMGWENQWKAVKMYRKFYTKRKRRLELNNAPCAGPPGTVTRSPQNAPYALFCWTHDEGYPCQPGFYDVGAPAYTEGDLARHNILETGKTCSD
jgi:hypothetical protein